MAVYWLLHPVNQPVNNTGTMMKYRYCAGMKKHTAAVVVFNNHTSRLCTCSTVSEEQAAVSEAAVSKAAVNEEQAAVSGAAGLAWGDSQHRLLALCAYGMHTGTRCGGKRGGRWGEKATKVQRL